MGPPERVDHVPAQKLTHIIFSFCHLKGNRLAVDNANDSLSLVKLAGLKKRNPNLKVIISLGGWGGCATCSEVFASEKGREDFTISTVNLLNTYQADGLDLDWEYPAIEGYPQHKFTPADREHFTELVTSLRKAFGRKYELSFAAGGFTQYLEQSIDWPKVMAQVDYVNLMSYDLINGYSTVTGHHTALYSRAEQKESTDNAVKYLLKIGVPANKIVIGSAFYGRMWENVPAENHGLYQSGKFKTGIDYNQFTTKLSEKDGYQYYWDDVVKAPYLYNETKKHFVTYDDPRSIRLKSEYVIQHKLRGIMFWELNGDLPAKGLLDTIINVKTGKK